LLFCYQTINFARFVKRKEEDYILILNLLWNEPHRRGCMGKMIKMEGEILDIKQFGKYLIISYKGAWGISFQQIRLDDGKLKK